MNSLLPADASGRALAGGLASFGTIEATPAQRPGIRFADWRFHYPRNGGLATDLRALRAGTSFANANPLMA